MAKSHITGIDLAAAGQDCANIAQSLRSYTRVSTWADNGFIAAIVLYFSTAGLDWGDTAQTVALVAAVVLALVNAYARYRVRALAKDLESLSGQLRLQEAALTSPQAERDLGTWDHSPDFWTEGSDGLRHVFVPDVADGSTVIEVMRWIASPGDEVQPLQPLAEVMYDSATVEIHAPITGVLQVIDLAAGAQAEVGAILCRLLPPKAASLERRAG